MTGYSPLESGIEEELKDTDRSVVVVCTDTNCSAHATIHEQMQNDFPLDKIYGGNLLVGCTWGKKKLTVIAVMMPIKIGPWNMVGHTSNWPLTEWRRRTVYAKAGSINTIL